WPGPLPAKWCPPSGHLAVTDLPALGLARDNVVVDDTAGRPVGLDADSLGADPSRAAVELRDHDVGDVMADRVGAAHGERGRTQGSGPVHRAEAEVGKVIGDICGEQLAGLV